MARETCEMRERKGAGESSVFARPHPFPLPRGEGELRGIIGKFPHPHSKFRCPFFRNKPTPAAVASNLQTCCGWGQPCSGSFFRDFLFCSGGGGGGSW